MNDEIKYLDYEGLQLFKELLDLKIQNEKETILSGISDIDEGKADIDDISPEVIIEDANGHEYVEIAGIKWATCNVGADNPDDEGLYFAWGETTGYTSELVGTDKDFSWEDYELTEDDGTTMTKYNSTDEKTILELMDDAASINMGGSWRMPTAAEWQALGEAVDTEWTNNYNDTGVSGLICTDKTDSSKVLFFPAAGECEEGNVKNVGYGCWYNSNTLNDIFAPIHMSSVSSSIDWNDVSGYRCVGLPIRGVLDTVQQKVLGTTITDAERSYWNSKQNALVSGTNIKTINGLSLLGSGDLRITTPVQVVNITVNTSSSCTITGNENSGKELLIIYRNNSGSGDLVVTVPTTYLTPNGSPIELQCKSGGYCEVNYINVDGVIYARGL